MFDLETVCAWLSAFYRHAPGYLQICSTGDWAGRAFRTNDIARAAGYVDELNDAGREGIYARVTTLAAPPRNGERGGAADTAAVIAWWADIDIAGPGHAEANLPPNVDAARAIVAAARLPVPTCWIHSGGGVYPYWMLDAPHVVNGDLSDLIERSRRWQAALGDGAAALGYRYGTGVGDLSRVLRIPGTVNRKAGLERACRLLGG